MELADRLRFREAVVDGLRRFFKERGFLEVELPLMASRPIPEATIRLFPVLRPDGGRWFLLPSPELYLKPLLAQGLERIFYLGPAFRAGERGRLHLPQFTILEWYGAGRDYTWLMEMVEELLPWLAMELRRSFSLPEGLRLEPPYPRLSLRSLYQELAGWDPWSEPDPHRFDLDMVERIEPWLPKDQPVFLKDYPIWRGSLARPLPPPQEGVERVELYLAGVELANGFSELVDRREQERRFMDELAEMGRGAEELPVPFLEQLEKLPPCAGMALGVDRLVMLLAGLNSVDETRAVPEPL